MPLPQFVAALGDLEHLTGNEAAARRQYALIGAIQKLLRANGVRTDLETAAFDVDHSVRLPKALSLAKAAHHERPSIDGDDVLAWALARNGRCTDALHYSKRALRLGTLDATKFFHRGMVERCLGHEADAKTWFRRALSLNPHFSLLWAPGRKEVRGMKRLVLLSLALAALALPAAASAHPLGNFTVNRFSRIEVAGPRVYVRYVLDLAEIPTFQAGKIDAQLYARRIARGAQLTVNGRRVRLIPVETALAHPAGAGGLKTTRFEVVLRGPALTGRSEIDYRDTNYANRIGWKEVLVGTAPSREPRASRVSEGPPLEPVERHDCPNEPRSRDSPWDSVRTSRVGPGCGRPTAWPTPASLRSSVAIGSASG